MAMKMMKAPKGAFTTWMAGFGMGIFAICIPFKEIATTGLPRLAVGAIGLVMWGYGLSYALKNQPKPEESRVEPMPSPSPSSL
jgi:hypothetical protein